MLRTPDRHIILIDAGSQTVSNLRRGVLEPYLQTLDCADVDQMILSDDSYAHLSAAGEIFRDCGHPTVFISPVFVRHAMGNIPAEDLLDTLFEAQTSPRILKKGDHLQLPGGATLDVLWPPPDCNLSANNCGLVMKFTCAGRHVSFHRRHPGPRSARASETSRFAQMRCSDRPPPRIRRGRDRGVPPRSAPAAHHCVRQRQALAPAAALRRSGVRPPILSDQPLWRGHHHG